MTCSRECVQATSILLILPSHSSFIPPLPPPLPQYFIKPFVQRKQRYNRWVRRRSLEKINHILNKVRYEKARYVFAARKEGGREGGS